VNYRKIGCGRRPIKWQSTNKCRRFRRPSWRSEQTLAFCPRVHLKVLGLSDGDIMSVVRSWGEILGKKPGFPYYQLWWVSKLVFSGLTAGTCLTFVACSQNLHKRQTHKSLWAQLGINTPPVPHEVPIGGRGCLGCQIGLDITLSMTLHYGSFRWGTLLLRSRRVLVYCQWWGVLKTTCVSAGYQWYHVLEIE